MTVYRYYRMNEENPINYGASLSLANPENIPSINSGAALIEKTPFGPTSSMRIASTSPVGLKIECLISNRGTPTARIASSQSSSGASMGELVPIASLDQTSSLPERSWARLAVRW